MKKFTTKSLKCILVFLGILNGTTISLADDDDFSKEVVKATPLSPSTYMFEGAGGNITALIGADGTLMVDDDFAPMANKLLAKLKELKGSRPRFIINTHFHYDHTGGNEVFGKYATIIANTEVRNRLMTEQTLWKKQFPPAPPQALPTLTFNDSLNLHINGEDVRIVHLSNGHTDGDTVVFFDRNKVVSLGDLYFSKMFPIFHPEHNGSLEGYVKNIEIILSQISDDTKIVAGHGPLTLKADLEIYRRMIVESIKTVRSGIAKGLSLEQIQKKGLSPEWEPFSHGYANSDRWIAMLYQSLKSGK